MGITNVNEQGSAYGAAFRNKPVYFMTGKETEAFFDGKMRRNMELREKIQVSAQPVTVISDAYHKPVDIKA